MFSHLYRQTKRESTILLLMTVDTSQWNSLVRHKCFDHDNLKLLWGSAPFSSVRPPPDLPVFREGYREWVHHLLQTEGPEPSNPRAGLPASTLLEWYDRTSSLPWAEIKHCRPDSPDE
eukprot:10056260-Alexandrium_andersonii.AAC.1